MPTSTAPTVGVPGATGSQSETDVVRLGYVPLCDAAPLIAAERLGYFSRRAVRVQLTPLPGWATLRDRLAFGGIDGAHMLAPMAVACGIGAMVAPGDIQVVSTLSRSGNTLTLGRALMADLDPAASDATPEALGVLLAAALARRRAAGLAPPRLAVVFAYSSHTYLLRAWLAAAGIDPDQDVQLVVVPPPLVARQLAAGHIEGFCAGEPWGSLAEADGVGRVVLTSADLWPNHPEKVLAISAHTAVQKSDQMVQVLAALMEAANWLQTPTNRAEAARMLADSAVQAPAALIEKSLGGVGAPVFGGSFPSRAHGVSWLAQMRRWRHVPAGTADTVIDRIWRADLWQQAAAGLSFPITQTAVPENPSWAG